MKRYSIFIRSKKFYWSNDRIVLPIILSCAAILLIKSKVLKLESNRFDDFLVLLLFAAFCIGILLKLFRIAKPDPLPGTLDGFLAFEPGRIVAGEMVYNLDEIEKVRITNDDYYGKMKGRHRGFNSGLSNGVDNLCEITLADGIIHRYNYELYYPNDLQKSRDALIGYYRAGKMDFGNLTRILAMDEDEIASLAR